ncbi:MAG TPA: PilZ domain-containing protein [Candidatus Limnocylindrales bacterium]|nr:PilZ domain-containing protein [Candidatus Limnocylindrales bacterium]
MPFDLESNGVQLTENLGERRSEPRFTRSLPIEVAGFDQVGHFFVERTSTLDVSSSGCKFTLRLPLKEGSLIAVRMLAGRKGPAELMRTYLFRVAHSNRLGNSWTVGVWKPQPSKPWYADFGGGQQPFACDS